MDKQRKFAYRMILYHAMLQIRPIAWTGHSWRYKLNPLYWRRELRRVRYCGAVADWLHNLAAFSATDFDGFDEEWFWQNFDSIRRMNPSAAEELDYYRSQFERDFLDRRDGS